MLIGDYGTGTTNQKKVAEYLNEVSEKIQADFVLSFGDNFYYPNGVTGIDDPKWNTHWADIYQNKSYLKNLKWYGVLGNHDYGGEDLYAQFKYNKFGWVIEDFFWTQTVQIQNKKLAIIHIDTSFLAHGILGEKKIPKMKEHFEELGWQNDENILDLVEQQLIEYQNYDWIIVTGHHQIGFSCPPIQNTYKLYPLFKKYNVDAYFSGHSHMLSYTVQDGMTILVSGAGAKSYLDFCKSANPLWSKGEILGFMSMELSEDFMQITAHYAQDDGEEQWQKLVFPSTQRKLKNNEW